MEKQWEGTTFGNGFMHRGLIKMLQAVDVRFFYVLAYIFVVPPCLLRPGFKHACHFYRNRLGYSRWKSFFMAIKNHCLFAQVVLDKFAMYGGKHFNIELEGYDNYLKLANQPDGFVLLSSHIGNYEIAGYSLVAENKPINALVYNGEKEEVMNNRQKLFVGANIHMIAMKSDMSHLFEINRALSDGETVSIPADRIWGSRKYVAQTFLGSEAHFPLGPFQVVAIREIEALTVHVMKKSYNTYKIYITPLHYDKNSSRTNRLNELSKNYVKELERIIRLYPAQWYNYFDFWAQ